MKPKNTHFLGFVWYFYKAMMYQKSVWYFFDQWSIDGKSEVKVEQRHLMEELKLKMLNMQKVTFSISTPPPGGTFELLLHFSYLWNIAQKSIIQIFDTLSINKFHWNFAPCLSGILNNVFYFWSQTVNEYKKELQNDPIVRAHLDSLYDNLMQQNLCRIIEPFSRVQVDHIASLIKLPLVSNEILMLMYSLTLKIVSELSHFSLRSRQGFI